MEGALGCTSSNGTEAGGPAVDAWAEHGCVSWEGSLWAEGLRGGRRQRMLKVVLKVMSATARVVRTEWQSWVPGFPVCRCVTVNKSFTIPKPPFSHGGWDEGAVRSKQTNALKVLSLLPGTGAPDDSLPPLSVPGLQ